MSKTSMVTPDEALPGRVEPLFTVPERHVVLDSSTTGPWAPGTERIIVAMGCFWGAEELYWQLPGVVSTSVGYIGGFTPNPTYEEVCTGRTGHAEAVQVVYDPEVISTYDILKAFWENHDPTQGMGQGNDIGTQYRSAIFVTTSGQRAIAEATRDAYAKALNDRGYGEITTAILSAADHPYFLAEDYHQQYLHKNPNGYRCHAKTGLDLPPIAPTA